MLSLLKSTPCNLIKTDIFTDEILFPKSRHVVLKAIAVSDQLIVVICNVCFTKLVPIFMCPVLSRR